MTQPSYCPTCDGILEFVGPIAITLHDGRFQADRYDCDTGHTVLVIATPDAVDAIIADAG